MGLATLRLKHDTFKNVVVEQARPMTVSAAGQVERLDRPRASAASPAARRSVRAGSSVSIAHGPRRAASSQPPSSVRPCRLDPPRHGPQRARPCRLDPAGLVHACQRAIVASPSCPSSFSARLASGSADGRVSARLDRLAGLSGERRAGRRAQGRPAHACRVRLEVLRLFPPAIRARSERPTKPQGRHISRCCLIFTPASIYSTVTV
jgi:hypothetical protein